MRKPHSFFSLDFSLLCLSSFLFFASFNMIIPELPAYLDNMGGAEYKGLIISLFTLSAGLSRPFSGKLADKIGRIPVMMIGASVCFVVGLLYPLLSFVGGFLFLRFVHGFSTGFTPTGASAYVADLVPYQKRGEAMGLFSLFGSLGMAAGPAVGGYLATIFTIDTVFYVSAFTAIFSILILWRLKETLPRKEAISWKMLQLNRDEIIEKRVLVPSEILFLCCFSFGVVLTIIPDFSTYLGIANKGLFFGIFTLSSLGIRLLAGKTSDRFGRVPVMRAACFTLVCAMLLLGLSDSKVLMMCSGVLFGCAVGMYSPTTAAWVVDLSINEFRGRALATMYIFLEAGIGIGALASGFLFANNPENFQLVFFTSAGFAGLAFVALFFVRRSPVN
ncbi:MFS transporter [Algoriphagus halophytocola]|uniref:MFS transporter n=1 Tax=Algoriphagus halophytocola TaxID=2991499 RepID=A0ABY6MNC2_9BACT|nr:MULTISPECIES: MFS transporter [unclassified Algoriphagus]UZD23709.1 MFS transporter [Algoriphagus sp. TR-M5]WBL45003.1 MFS transporter [Algoriphagus sp. TR-M9]